MKVRKNWNKKTIKQKNEMVQSIFSVFDSLETHQQRVVEMFCLYFGDLLVDAYTPFVSTLGATNQKEALFFQGSCCKPAAGMTKMAVEIHLLRRKGCIYTCHVYA